MKHQVEQPPPRLLTPLLSRAPTTAFVAYATFAAFSTYFCMYAFRKPLAAAAYGDATIMLPLLAKKLDLKTVFVIAQIIGYCLSKYLGMKICSEVRAKDRFRFLIGAIVVAHTALLLFAVLPGLWKVPAIFLNGLPLGMVWGLVVRYLEGRRTSELLLTGMSCSYMIASGIVKSVGRWLMEQGVSEYWMPFTTGALFAIPFVVAVWLLNQLPMPTENDIAERTERPRMDQTDRWRFLRVFLPGMTMLCVAYFFLTAYRDYRDNYMLEIYGHFRAEEFIQLAESRSWIESGALADELRGFLAGSNIPEDKRAGAALVWLVQRGNVDPSAATEVRESGALEVSSDAFAKTDLPIGFAVLLPLALLTLVSNNRHGMMGAYGIMISGLVLMGVSTALLQASLLSSYWWMVLVGTGAYLAYVPYGSVLFDRTIAATHFVGTAVFAIYLTDAIGYTGSVGMQLYKDLFASSVNRGEFFVGLTWFMSLFGVVMMIASAVYFNRRAVSMSREAESAGEL